MTEPVAPRANLALIAVLLTVTGIVLATTRQLADGYDAAVGALFIAGGAAAAHTALRWHTTRPGPLHAAAGTAACLGRAVEVAVWAERPVLAALGWGLAALGVWSTWAWAYRAIAVRYAGQTVIIERAQSGGH